MKKEDQQKENLVVLEEFKALEDALPTFRYLGDIDFIRLRSCNAKVGVFNDYTILVSYSTVVAFIKDDKLYDVLRYNYGYTATSAQHIAKFAHDYGVKERYTWREL